MTMTPERTQLGSEHSAKGVDYQTRMSIDDGSKSPEWIESITTDRDGDKKIETARRDIGILTAEISKLLDELKQVESDVLAKQAYHRTVMIEHNGLQQEIMQLNQRSTELRIEYQSAHSTIDNEFSQKKRQLTDELQASTARKTQLDVDTIELHTRKQAIEASYERRNGQANEAADLGEFHHVDGADVNQEIAKYMHENGIDPTGYLSTTDGINVDSPDYRLIIDQLRTASVALTEENLKMIRLNTAINQLEEDYSQAKQDTDMHWEPIFDKHRIDLSTREQELASVTNRLVEAKNGYSVAYTFYLSKTVELGAKPLNTSLQPTYQAMQDMDHAFREVE